MAKKITVSCETIAGNLEWGRWAHLAHLGCQLECRAHFNLSIVVILNFFYCPQEWAEWGVTQLQLSTVDFNNAPSQEMIRRGVAFIEEMNENEKTVYVHCKAGRGRSTTLVACYLMKVCSFTANCIPGFRLSKSRLTLE